MRILSLVILCVAYVEIAGRSIDSKKSTQEQSWIDLNNGIRGLTTIAGVTSRNGRVSSVNHINFYPGPDSKSTYITNQGTYYPLTVSAEKDGRYASGTVQVYPGYVSASSRAGYAPPEAQNHQDHYKAFEYPRYESQTFQQPFKEFLYQPPNFFSTPTIENLFSNDFFKSFPSATPNDLMRNSWIVPGFDPFVNFWRR